MALCKKIYGSLQELRDDLDAWLRVLQTLGGATRATGLSTGRRGRHFQHGVAMTQPQAG